MENIICKTCETSKPQESFWWMWKSKGIRRKVCIPCTKERRNGSVETNGKLTCTKCSVTKKPIDFQSHSKQCRACIAKYLRDRRKTLGREITTQPRSCKRCHTLKDPVDFRKSRDSIGGIRRTCRECEGLPLKRNIAIVK